MITLGPRSMKLLDQALDVTPTHPLAFSLKGNVKSYLPAVGGGSNRQAVEFFNKCINLFDTDCHARFRWNYCAINLCLAQTYQKMGKTAEARSVALHTLEFAPNYVAIRDEFLPQLNKSSKK